MGGAVTTALWIWWTLAAGEWVLGLHPVVPGMVVAGVLMWLVALFTTPVREEATRKFFPEDG